MDEAISPWCDDTYRIVQPEMDWLRLAFWESVFSLTNGRLGTRGSFEEPMDGTRSRPMTFMAGLYDTLPKGLPELPVLPDWLSTRIVLDGAVFDLRRGRIRRFVRALDMRRGVLVREIEWQDLQGRTTHLAFTRFLSLADRRLAALRIRVTPLDWSGSVHVDAGLAPPPGLTFGKPSGSPRRSPSHWSPLRTRTSPHGLALIETRTRQTHRPLAVAVAFDVRIGGRVTVGEPLATADHVGCSITHDASAGQGCEFDRFVVFAAGDPGAKPPSSSARDAADLARRDGFDVLLERHVAATSELWSRIDVTIDGPPDDQRAIRYNLYQLATLCPPMEDIASIGPKGLTGTHYAGHVFWDTEIYMLPFFALTDPAGARTLLMYRYHTLEGARRKAAASGFRGAQFAWESADTGDEACPKYVTDPASGTQVRIWCGEIQDHVTADVALAVDRYVRATGDNAFLRDYGAELLFETARFWAGRAAPTDAGGFEIRDSMGPDEYHVHVDNDAFTNYLAHWNLLAAADLHDARPMPADAWHALIGRLGLRPDEPAEWRRVAESLRLAYDPLTGLIEQCDGFFDRPDVSPDVLRLPRRTPLTDVIGAGLVIEGQVLKQAEVVLLQCLLADRFDARSRAANFDHYEPRTTHDSSLSVSAHAWAAARLGRPEQAYEFFRRAAFLDLQDLAGNTDAGLHTANLGGVWLALTYGFAGLNLDGPTPSVAPALPAAWKSLSFTIIYRGQRYRIDCRPDAGTVTPI